MTTRCSWPASCTCSSLSLLLPSAASPAGVSRPPRAQRAAVTLSQLRLPGMPHSLRHSLITISTGRLAVSNGRTEQAHNFLNVLYSNHPLATATCYASPSYCTLGYTE